MTHQIDLPGMGANACLIAIDPGKKAFGWAHFRQRELHSCGLADTATGVPLDGRPRNGCVWVCEMPEQRGRQSKVRMPDLLDLALAAGRVVGLNPCDFVKPSRWIGQLDNDLLHDRMFEALGNSEHDVYFKAQKATNRGVFHNVQDAISLGLWRLGRI